MKNEITLTEKVVVHAAFPKSGSQSTRDMIRRIMGERTALVVPKTHGGFGHNVIATSKLPRLRRFFTPCLVYGHITPTGYNVSELEVISQSTWFVSIRKLMDVVVSYKEHIDRAGVGPLDYRLPGLSEGVVDWDFLSADLKYSYIIRFIMPWYVRFVAGWWHVGTLRPVEFIRFESVINDPVGTLTLVSRCLGVTLKDGDIRRPVPKVNVNVGEIGRGDRILKSFHKQELERLLDFYQEIRDSELGAYLIGK